MKKTISIILAVTFLCTSLVGCGDTQPSETKAEITRYTTEGKETKMVPDETLTGELNVDLGTFGVFRADELENAKKLYNKLYPNVNLTIEKDNIGNPNYDYTAANKKMQAEIMAGKGPDVFVADYSINDCYKQMKTGVYADLTSYFENDKSFNVSDFAENVLYTGQYNGKQYLVPTSFEFNHFSTTQSIIDETGFDIKKNTDFLSLEEELLRVLDENKFNCAPENVLPGFGTAYWFLNDIDSTWMDYNNNTANLVGNKNVKKAFENTKKFMPYLYLSHNSGKPYEAGTELSMTMFEALSLRYSMFIVANYGSLVYKIQTYRDLKATGQTQVILPIKDFNGKKTAIIRGGVGVNSNSKNIPAAYAFVKLLLSNEFYEITQDDRGQYHYPGEENGKLPLNKKFFKEFALKQGVKGDGKSGDKTLDVNWKIIPAYMMTSEDVEMLADIYYSAEVCRFNAGNIYNIMDKMDAFILKNGDYESAIKAAQSDAEIALSE